MPDLPHALRRSLTALVLAGRCTEAFETKDTLELTTTLLGAPNPSTLNLTH